VKVGDLVRVRSSIPKSFHMESRSSGATGIIREILHFKFAEVLIFDDGKRKQYHMGHLEVISESR
jgi:hypothetical protein